MSRISLITVFFSFLIGTSSFADVDLAYLDKNFCPQVIEQAGSNIKSHPIYFTSNEYGDYFLQRRAIEGGYKYVLVSGLGTKELPSSIKKVRDFAAVEDKLYILERHQLIELTRRGRVLDRIQIPDAVQAHNFARSMVYFPNQNALYLAQGKLGLVKFDLMTKSFVSRYPLNRINDSGHLSSAVSVSIKEDQMFVAMTGRSEEGFNGVVVFEPATNTIVNLAQYNKRRAGVIFPYASIYANDEGVFLNNGGWIHQISYRDILNKKIIRPTWRAIEHISGNYRQYIMLRGDLIFGRDGIMGCGVKRNRENNQLTGSAFSYK